ncbi:MAG: hypothetical protein ABJH72_17440 [Reichenbachiella sp.]|uniref:hypothetical protein n=1 Tax=Reichenbachiella sp. TaxID=2184521 RepID=UPI0032969992
MNKKGNIFWAYGLVLAAYLLTDIVHFFNNRIDVIYPSYAEAVYESHELSYIKWVLCIIGIIVIIGMTNLKSYSKATLWGISLMTILIYFFKGKFSNLMIGSLFFDLLILELASFLLIIYMMVKLVKKSETWYLELAVSTLVVFGLFFFYINQLPSFIMFEN